MSTNQSFRPDSRQIVSHQYGISVSEVQTYLLAKYSSDEEQGETAVFAGYYFSCCFILPAAFPTLLELGTVYIFVHVV